jgi:hypothetical protein
MLPRLKQWLDQALGADPGDTLTDGADDFPASMMGDDKLSVSESTITEYSRAIASYTPKDEQRP